jgi:hypothetical protein
MSETNTLGFIRKLFKIVFYLGLVAVIVIIVFVVGGITVFSGHCSKQRSAASAAAQPAIALLNGTTILPGAPNPSAVVTNGGDCVDSKPYVQAVKTIPVNVAGATALTNITTSLNSQGYTATGTPEFDVDRCNYIQADLPFKKDGTTLTVILEQNASLSSQCLGMSQTTQTYFSAVTIQQIIARVYYAS